MAISQAGKDQAGEPNLEDSGKKNNGVTINRQPEAKKAGDECSKLQKVPPCDNTQRRNLG